MAEVYRQVHRTTAADDDIDAVPTSEYSMNVAARVIYFIGGVILALLALRFLLMLLGANRGSGFVNFIYSASHPFVSPFFGLFNYQEQFGAHRFEFETLIAMLVYGLVTVLLARLVTIGSRRRDV
jgi:YggT family protein